MFTHDSFSPIKIKAKIAVKTGIMLLNVDAFTMPKCLILYVKNKNAIEEANIPRRIMGIKVFKLYVADNTLSKSKISMSGKKKTTPKIL